MYSRLEPESWTDYNLEEGILKNEEDIIGEQFSINNIKKTIKETKTKLKGFQNSLKFYKGLISTKEKRIKHFKKILTKRGKCVNMKL